MSSNHGDTDAYERVDRSSSSGPKNVGILSIATYFPKTYVSQADLEAYDKVDAGKYTKGLMQDKMGFCTDLEDINSIALTVTKKLIDQSGVALNNIGYLEVGTETIVDKSKSVKTVLMDLFESSGNTDIEGVDTTNACYGGTAALFHAIDHCSSPYWDGRLAIVVAADIAVYDKGNARPTGGCGAIAMLIGPNAPLTFSPFRASHMTNKYDFYKPDPHSEYPTVDGKLSLEVYISAVDQCYKTFRRKFYQNVAEAKQPQLLDCFDAVLFHSPYCKLVRKAFARLLFNDYCVVSKIESKDSDILKKYKLFGELPESAVTLNYADWMKPIEKGSLEKLALLLSEDLYRDKTADSLYLANQVGNMYTASLYSCLVAYLTAKPAEELVDKRLLFFSYGSGSASSMFTAQLSSDIQAVRKLLQGVQDVREKLSVRIKVSPEEFSAHLDHRKKTFSLPGRFPTGQPIEADSKEVGIIKLEEYLYPGTYYLTSIDAKFRRHYSLHSGDVEKNNNYEASCILEKGQIKNAQVPADIIQPTRVEAI